MATLDSNRFDLMLFVFDVKNEGNITHYGCFILHFGNCFAIGWPAFAIDCQSNRLTIQMQ